MIQLEWMFVYGARYELMLFYKYGYPIVLVKLVGKVIFFFPLNCLCNETSLIMYVRVCLWTFFKICLLILVHLFVLLPIFWSSVVRCINTYNGCVLEWIDLVIIMKWPSLSLLVSFIQKTVLSDINITTEVFLWLVLTWYIFSHTFTCNLIMPL